MLVNADFSRPVIVTPDEYRWTASPQRGVERMMLDRIGDEQARATSIVRYAPASNFPVHTHPRGEEILVLSGVFSDNDGDYAAGWYLRNPPGSSHRPHTVDGAVIFVKLRQMARSDNQTVRIDTNADEAWHRRGSRAVCPLFSGAAEEVALHRLDAGQALFEGAVESAEVLVLSGDMLAAGRRCSTGAWIRLPAGEWPELVAGDDGARVYLKTGQARRVGPKG